MNIDFSSDLSLDTKDVSIPEALYPNTFKQDEDGKAIFHARTTTLGNCDDEMIADDLIAAGLNNGRSKEQILNDMAAERFARLLRLAKSFVVNDGINRYQIVVKGKFNSESEQFSSEKHSVEISVHATPQANELFEGVSVVIRQGNSRKPEITEVNDIKSKSKDTLTKGGFLEIVGANIKICGEKEENGLYFVNTADSSKTVKLSADELGFNTSTKVACVVPLSLESGSYSIRLVTQFMGGNKIFRKEAQTAVFGTFTVE